MTFSELIKSRRAELGLTLEDVARAVGVKKSTILRWESGEIDNPRRDRIALLAAVLQVPPVALVQEQCGLPEDYPISKNAAESLTTHSSFKSPKNLMTNKPLTHTEYQLLDLFHQLNQEGQARVIGFVTFCTNDPALLKDPPAVSAS